MSLLNSNFKESTGFFLFCISFLFLSCEKDKEKNNKSIDVQKKANLELAPKKDKSESAWVISGKYKVVEGLIVSGGGKKGPVKAGEKLSCFINIKGLIKNENLKADVKIVGPEGVYYKDSRTLLKGSSVKGSNGIVGLVLNTGSDWPTGMYSIQADISQTGKSGTIIAPFEVSSREYAGKGFQLREVIYPEKISSGRKFPVYILLGGVKKGQKVSVNLQIRRKGGSVLSTVAKDITVDKHRINMWKVFTLIAPEEASNYQMLVSIETEGKRIKTGEGIKVVSPGPIANVMILNPDANPGKIWYRQDEGMLSAMFFGKGSVVIDVGITGPDKGIYFIKKNTKREIHPNGTAISFPFTVPEFAPAGKYAVKLRMKMDSRFFEYEAVFNVGGRELKPASGYTVKKLQLGNNGIFITDKNPVLRVPGTIHASFVMEGMKANKLSKTVAGHTLDYFETSSECVFSVTKPLLEAPEYKSSAFQVKNTWYHSISPMRINTVFRIPRKLSGRYFLKLDCSDKNSIRSTQLQKQVVFR
ncbi:MAG: hypothetical protein JXR95_14730 [Deltaproteobacteria bacterium]|nr:hypothetical protein [Deltaproteobacteria bacterium]